MDEIELLREFRAGLPGPRPGSRDAARASMVERFGREEVGPGHPAGRRPRRRLLLGAALACLAMVVALPILLLGGKTEVEPAAAEVLRQAAGVARSQPAEPQPGPGQYAYTRSRTGYITTTVGLSAVQDGRGGRGRGPASGWSVLVPRERQIWIAPDGSGRIREVAGRARFLSGAQRAAWVAAGSPRLPSVARASDETFTPHQLRYFRSVSLPTDPKELRRLIEARKIPGIGGPPGEAETFELIGEMLRETDLRPTLRAAIYEVCAELPGIQLLGPVRDPAGRQGTGVAFTDRSRGIRHELIFDPADSALLGEREVVVGGWDKALQVPAGTVVGYASYLESRVVDSTAIPAPHERTRSGDGFREAAAGIRALDLP
jgi:hypothetical protein